MACEYKNHTNQQPYDCDCTVEECTKEIVHSSDISLPVKMYAGACVDGVETDFSEDPVVDCKQMCSKGCSLTITQRVHVKIPVTYCVTTCVGDSMVECCPENG